MTQLKHVHITDARTIVVSENGGELPGLELRICESGRGNPQMVAFPLHSFQRVPDVGALSHQIRKILVAAGHIAPDSILQTEMSVDRYSLMIAVNRYLADDVMLVPVDRPSLRRCETASTSSLLGNEPPVFAQRFLDWSLPAARSSDVIGDLDERYIDCILHRDGKTWADRWYWRQAIGTVWPMWRRTIWSRVRGLGIVAGVGGALGWLWEKFSS